MSALIIDRHNARTSLLRFAGNAASLLTTDLLNKATTFVIYTQVARYLPATAFGRLSLGLLLVYVFQVLASVGLPNLLTREISQRSGRTPRLLANGLVTAAFTSALAMLAMLLTAWSTNYDRQTALTISIFSLGLFPFAASQVFEASFRGAQRMHFIAIANVLANAIKVVGAIYLMRQGFGALWLVALLVMVRGLVLLVDMLLYFVWSGGKLAPWDRRYVWALLRRNSTFLGIDAAIACWSAVDALILSKFMSILEVGLYNAALQLLQPASLVYLSIVGSIFPAMCRRFRHQVDQPGTAGHAQLVGLTRWMVAFLLMMGLPAVVLILAFADVILHVAYAKPDFLRSVPVMRIACFALIAQCFTTILGHALWAANREGLTLRIVVTNLTANVIISSFTIYYWGLIGAAAGTLAVSILNVLQHFVAYRTVLHKSPVDWQLLSPTIAALAMGCVIWLAPQAWADSLLSALPISLQTLLADSLPDPQRYALALLGLLTYGVTVTGLVSISYGGPRKLRDGFFAPLVS